LFVTIGFLSLALEFAFHQRLCPLVVLLGPRPQRPRKVAEVVASRHAVLLPPAGVVTSHGLLPKLLSLIRVYLSFPGAALDEGVEFLLRGLASADVSP
jgi:hypothetical protein